MAFFKLYHHALLKLKKEKSHENENNWSEGECVGVDIRRKKIAQWVAFALEKVMKPHSTNKALLKQISDLSRGRRATIFRTSIDQDEIVWGKIPYKGVACNWVLTYLHLTWNIIIKVNFWWLFLWKMQLLFNFVHVTMLYAAAQLYVCCVVLTNDNMSRSNFMFSPYLWKLVALSHTIIISLIVWSCDEA